MPQNTMSLQLSNWLWFNLGFLLFDSFSDGLLSSSLTSPSVLVPLLGSSRRSGGDSPGGGAPVDRDEPALPDGGHLFQPPE